MSDEKNLDIEFTETTTKFVDVSMEDVDGPCVSVSMSGEAGDNVMVMMIENDTVDELEEQHVVFPASQWEDIKRMGDAAIAAYREKFAGPS